MLFYQENGNYLRKIKLKLNDVSKIEDVVELQVGDSIELNSGNKSETISIDGVTITDRTDYTTRVKTALGSTIETKDLVIEGDSRILRIDFASDVWEAKNMIDFLNKYGKLIYKDSEGEEEVVNLVNPINKSYYGKSIYFKVPVELESSEDVYFDLIVRNKHYKYKLN